MPTIQAEAAGRRHDLRMSESALDAYYDLGHGIYGSGTGGVIELVIDILLAAGSGLALRWAWVQRHALLAGRAPRG
jgi:hypothetical protein